MSNHNLDFEVSVINSKNDDESRLTKFYNDIKFWTRIIHLLFNGRFDTFQSSENLGFELPSPSYYIWLHRVHVLISCAIMGNIILGIGSYTASTQEAYT